MAVLTALLGVVAALQYRWITQTSEAVRTTMRETLRGALINVSRDFDAEFNNALAALQPSDADVEKLGMREAYTRRFVKFNRSSSDAAVFRRVAVAWEEDGRARIDMLSGAAASGEWPPDWQAARLWVQSRGFNSRQTQRPQDFGTNLIDWPRFGDRHGPPGEQDWLLAEVDPLFVSKSILPRLLARYLGPNSAIEFRFEVSSKTNAPKLLFSSDPSKPRIGQADQTTGLLSVASPVSRLQPRLEPGPHRPFPRALDPPWPARWTLAVELQSGSLDNFVKNLRRKNLAISGAVLLLLIGASAALMRFSRQAERLAATRMEFVSNVSHELRTPLTVIRTAAYNLRPPLSESPERVEGYGQLITRESERLSEMIDHILQFSSGDQSRHRRQIAVPVEQLIQESLETSSPLIKSADCRIETSIDANVPAIQGDPVPLRQALNNLIANAVKYGLGDKRWIGIFARRINHGNGSQIEIRVADRGRGIPPEEQPHVFDPFFRGGYPIAQQIHGTGLGLNLAKRAIEANGGSVSLESEPGSGTTFILLFPIQS